MIWKDVLRMLSGLSAKLQIAFQSLRWRGTVGEVRG